MPASSRNSRTAPAILLRKPHPFFLIFSLHIERRISDTLTHAGSGIFGGIRLVTTLPARSFQLAGSIEMTGASFPLFVSVINAFIDAVLTFDAHTLNPLPMSCIT